MNNMLSSSLIVVFVLFTVAVAVASAADDVGALVDGSSDSTTTMIRINSEIDQSINSITIDPLCTDYVDENNNVCNVPSTIFTIVSSDNDGDGSVTVESSPANLVTATTWRNTLAFEWNHTVASTAKSGSSSVRIGIPSDQLLSVSVMNGQTAQLVEGFTNITYLVLTGADSVLRASMTTSISTELELDNDDIGNIHMPLSFSFSIQI